MRVEEDGNYVIDRLFPGKYRLLLGPITVARNILVENGKVARINIEVNETDTKY